jgi:Cft2 family RNA processing exonuclease
MVKTIAIDFDGVIHKYSRGWQDGSIYDDEIASVFESIQELMKTYSVFILSTRNSRTIKKWIKQKTTECDYLPYELSGFENPPEYCYPKYGFTCQVIPFWVKFWNKRNCLGITNRKLPAHAYVDDRAIVFTGDWQKTKADINSFKPYNQK